MPIYEFKCTKCAKEFELLCKLNDSTVQTCPYCNKLTAERMLSLSSFRLKGTGWYATDFKNQDKKQNNKQDQPTDKVACDEVDKTQSKSADKEKSVQETGKNQKESKQESKRENKRESKQENKPKVKAEKSDK